MLAEYNNQKKRHEEERHQQVVGPIDFSGLRREERAMLRNEIVDDVEQEQSSSDQQRKLEPEIGSKNLIGTGWTFSDEIQTDLKNNECFVGGRKRHMERGGGVSPPPKRVSSGELITSPSNFAVRDGFGFADGGNSNSSWRQTMQPILIGNHCLYPLSIEMEQRLILNYLGPTSEYQDVKSFQLIF